MQQTKPSALDKIPGVENFNMKEKTIAVLKILLTLLGPLLIVYIYFPGEFATYITALAIIIALFREMFLKFYFPPRLKISLAESPKNFAEVQAKNLKTGQVVDLHASIGVVIENVGLTNAENVSVLFNGIESTIVKDIMRYRSLPLIRSWFSPQTNLKSIPPKTPIRFSIGYVAKSFPDVFQFEFVQIPNSLNQIKCPRNAKSTFEFEIKAISDNSKAVSATIEILFMADYINGLVLNLRNS
jgi:hypothetical protein